MPVININGKYIEWWRMIGCCFAGKSLYCPSDFGLPSNGGDAIEMGFCFEHEYGNGNGYGMNRNLTNVDTNSSSSLLRGYKCQL